MIRLILVLFCSVVVSSTTDNSTSPLCGLRTSGVIEYNGYLAEEHHVTTADGYILSVFRCNSKEPSSGKKKAVILQHGLLCSSDDFIENTHHRSLPFVLADAGFDVWLPNSRGNYYSRNHTTLSPDSSAFWNFTWYEMGVLDHPAVIDYILTKTRNEKLYYSGHSQGGTSLLVLLSEKPEYNNKISIASLMAPVTFASGWATATKDWALSLYLPNSDALVTTEFFPRRATAAEFEAASPVCKVHQTFCDSMKSVMVDPMYASAMEASIACHYPSGISYKQVIHYVQETKYNFFGKYMEGTEVSANFTFTNIVAPTSFHYSTGDALADADDIETILPILKNVAYTQKISNTSFTHYDFIWNDEADIVYSKIVSLFEEY